jgi:transketolase
MRKIFFRELCKLAEQDKDVMFLTGDLGFSFFEEFQAKYPKQFINCGAIEQSMIGIAAGLALAGKKPYVYSTIPFLLFRPFEQVRDDIAYQNANVKLIGVAMSGFIGFTHEISENEDIKVIGHLPNFKIHIPKNEEELTHNIQESYNVKGPTYIRLGSAVR